MPDKRPTMREVVVAFMTVFSGSPMPSERLAMFLRNLRKDQRWTEEELAVVQQEIEERLKPPGDSTAGES